MLDKEQRQQARDLIRNTVADMIFTCFEGCKTEEDIKRLIVALQKLSSSIALNAAILENLLAGVFVGSTNNSNEAKK